MHRLSPLATPTGPNTRANTAWARGSASASATCRAAPPAAPPSATCSAAASTPCSTRASCTRGCPCSTTVSPAARGEPAAGRVGVRGPCRSPALPRTGPGAAAACGLTAPPPGPPVNPCELHCRPSKEYFAEKLRDAVVDGTPCYQGQASRDLCINGICKVSPRGEGPPRRLPVLHPPSAQPPTVGALTPRMPVPAVPPNSHPRRLGTAPCDRKGPCPRRPVRRGGLAGHPRDGRAPSPAPQLQGPPLRVLQNVGCDFEIDSGALEDRCGVCRGNGSTCHTVSGTFQEAEGLGTGGPTGGRQGGLSSPLPSPRPWPPAGYRSDAPA